MPTEVANACGIRFLEGVQQSASRRIAFLRCAVAWPFARAIVQLRDDARALPLRELLDTRVVSLGPLALDPQRITAAVPLTHSDPRGYLAEPSSVLE